MHTNERGFTLIEILIVIGMLAILATIVLVAINPLRQFAQARNTQRQANVAAILNAVGNRIADNRGVFAASGSACAFSNEEARPISNTDTINGLDLRPCLVPNYIPELPTDPLGHPYFNTCGTDLDCTNGSYNTGYTIRQDPGTARITVCAPESLEPALDLTGPDQMFCLSR